MRLRELEVRKFGRLEDLCLPVSGVNIFIGPNGAGKSTIVNSMLFATERTEINPLDHPASPETAVTMRFEDRIGSFVVSLCYWLFEKRDELGLEALSQAYEVFRSSIPHGKSQNDVCLLLFIANLDRVKLSPDAVANTSFLMNSDLFSNQEEKLEPTEILEILYHLVDDHVDYLLVDRTVVSGGVVGAIDWDLALAVRECGLKDGLCPCEEFFLNQQSSLESNRENDPTGISTPKSSLRVLSNSPAHFAQSETQQIGRKEFASYFDSISPVFASLSPIESSFQASLDLAIELLGFSLEHDVPASRFIEAENFGRDTGRGANITWRRLRKWSEGRGVFGVGDLKDKYSDVAGRLHAGNEVATFPIERAQDLGLLSFDEARSLLAICKTLEVLAPDFLDEVGVFGFEVKNPKYKGQLPGRIIPVLGGIPIIHLSSGHQAWMRLSLEIALLMYLNKSFLWRQNAGIESFTDFEIDLRDFVILLDEPELHLHPKALSSVARKLESLPEKGAQLFIATHDSRFFDLRVVDCTKWQVEPIRRTTPPALRNALENENLLKVGDGAIKEDLFRQFEELDSFRRRMAKLTRVTVAPSESFLHTRMGLTDGEIALHVRSFLFVEGPHDEVMLETLFGDRLRDHGIRIVKVDGDFNMAAAAESEMVTMLGKEVLALVDYSNLKKKRNQKSEFGKWFDRQKKKDPTSVYMLQKFDILTYINEEVMQDVSSNHNFTTWKDVDEEWFSISEERRRSLYYKSWLIETYGLPRFVGEDISDDVKRMRLRGLLKHPKFIVHPDLRKAIDTLINRSDRNG